MKVAFIGPDNFERTKEIMARLRDVIVKLVVSEGADIFLFTNEGFFDNACWQIVTKLQELYPNIRRIYARTEYEDEDEFLQGIMICYEDTFIPNAVSKAGISANFIRNKIMVDACDVLITYCDVDNVQMPRIKGDSEITVEYAHKKKKRVINLFET